MEIIYDLFQIGAHSQDILNQENVFLTRVLEDTYFKESFTVFQQNMEGPYFEKLKEILDENFDMED